MRPIKLAQPPAAAADTNSDVVIEVARASSPPSKADVAVAVEALGVAARLKEAAEAMLDGSATDEQKDAVRAVVRLARGIPEDQPEAVVCLNVAAWIEQARAERRDGEWLKWQAMKLDPKFEGVDDSAFENALTPPIKPGKDGSISEAAALLKAAGRHIEPCVLAGTARKLRSRSKPTP